MSRTPVYYNCEQCGAQIKSSQYHAIGKCEACSGRLVHSLRKYSCLSCGKEISYWIKRKYEDICRKCYEEGKEPKTEPFEKIRVKGGSEEVCGNCADWESLGDSNYGSCYSEDFMKKRLHESLHTHAITKACGYFIRR